MVNDFNTYFTNKKYKWQQLHKNIFKMYKKCKRMFMATSIFTLKTNTNEQENE